MSRLAIAWTSAIVGDVDSALREAAGSLEELRGQDEPLWTAAALITLGSLETAAGRSGKDFYVTCARRMTWRSDSATTGSSRAPRYSWAYLAVMRQRPEEARAVLDQGLELSLAIHSTRNMILCLTAFAQLAFEEGDPERTALLAGAAEGLRQAGWAAGVADRAAGPGRAGRPGPPGAGGREVRADIRRRCQAQPAGGGRRRPRPARRPDGLPASEAPTRMTTHDSGLDPARGPVVTEIFTWRLDLRVAAHPQRPARHRPAQSMAVVARPWSGW